MNKKPRHVLGISGGKDSAALAIYLFQKYPQLNIEYYTCDTGKELDETYQLIENLEVYLGKKIERIVGAPDSQLDPFDHFLEMFGGFLPSSNARWCTKYLKLYPFEKFVGIDPVVSYVGIRGDEEREGYISRKSNIQSIFPFRRNIWSEDIINKFLSNENIDLICSIAEEIGIDTQKNRFTTLFSKRITPDYSKDAKLIHLLNRGIKETNYVVFEFLKTANYPLSEEEIFPLLENEEVLVRDDIFKILESSGVGVPEYYRKTSFSLDNKIGEYARSRSGCFFCFFQQKIEWVWLLEKHPDRYDEAMKYENEKAGFTWNQNESLNELKQPNRVSEIKAEYLKKQNTKTKSKYLHNILDFAESEGCAACFI